MTRPKGNDGEAAVQVRSNAALAHHYRQVISGIKRGSVVPFLGAGVNLWKRPKGSSWRYGDRSLLPNGKELAAYLVGTCGYPPSGFDLARAAHYVSVLQGPGPLYQNLRDIFVGDYAPNPLHNFLVTLPEFSRTTGQPPATDDGETHRKVLIVTTNYDDILETAFRMRNEPHHIVSYLAYGEDRGKFLHWHWLSKADPPPNPQVVHIPNTYLGLSEDDHPIILKLHGAIDRVERERDSFVISEDDYIEYLTRTDVSKLLPFPIPEKLSESGFLFLGYSLRDWNLRVILHRIWSEQKKGFASWAVQLKPDKVDTKYWSTKNVEVIEAQLELYISGLEQALEVERQKLIRQAGG